MSGKRDYVSEVLAVRERRAELHRVLHRLDSLGGIRGLRQTPAGGDNTQEVDDFIPIRAVTVLEVFMRRWIAALVDRGAPFSGNASKLAASGKVKLDFEAIEAIHGGRVTLGDLVAHGVSLNRIEDVLATFSALLGCDFDQELRRVHDRFAVEREGKPQEPIIADFPAFRAAFAKLFVARHIVVHEVPAEPPFKTEDLAAFVLAAKQFVKASTQVFSTAAYGNYALCTMDMVAEHAQKQQALEKELSDVLEQVRAAVPNVEALEAAQQAWMRYRECEKVLAGSVLEGGSLQPIAILSTERLVTRARIEDLRWWLERRDGDLWRVPPEDGLRGVD